MVQYVSQLVYWGASQAHLLFPLAIALWIAWGDLRTYRIPNYLTLSTALLGLVYQAAAHGWAGLGDGLLGLILGLFLLLPPYLMGGIGAGDVKALAALGTWLGPGLTLMLFFYMALAGGLLALGVLIYKGLLWRYLRRACSWFISWLLFRPAGMAPAPSATPTTPGIPYGVAIALGMVVLVWRGG